MIMFLGGARELLRIVTVAALLFLADRAATAQTFPSQTIRIVVGTGTASPPDIISRVVAADIGETEGWKVIVENKTGAIQTLGGADVAKSPADGHSIWAVSLPVASAPALLRKMPVDLVNDFDPLINVAVSQNVLVAHPSVPVSSMDDLVALLRKEPGRLNYASGGNGTPAHLLAELFKLETGTVAAHVPYQSPGSMVSDLVGGSTQFSFISTVMVAELVKAEKLNALAMASKKPVAALPAVKTVVDLGYPKLTMDAWTAMLVRKGTPADAVTRLNTAINRALAKDSVRVALAKTGAEPVGGTPEAFGALLRSEIAHWGDVVRRAGIKMD